MKVLAQLFPRDQLLVEARRFTVFMAAETPICQQREQRDIAVQRTVTPLVMPGAEQLAAQEITAIVRQCKAQPIIVDGGTVSQDRAGLMLKRLSIELDASLGVDSTPIFSIDDPVAGAEHLADVVQGYVQVIAHLRRRGLGPDCMADLLLRCARAVAQQKEQDGMECSRTI
jgi:hypothetical protein